MTHLTDSKAKEILIGWPERTKKLWPAPIGEGYWLRCQPVQGQTTAPRLVVPGATMFKSQPDGLWAFFGGLHYCDAVAIEVCGSIQNLNDKRSRYAFSGHSTLLGCTSKWFAESITVQNGGKAERWQACRTIKSKPKNSINIPIRHLRVLYAIPNELYKKWAPEHVPSGHEFFCRHSSLQSYNAAKMQTFLRRMAIGSHFYTAV
jgi:hypothetical protein